MMYQMSSNEGPDFGEGDDVIVVAGAFEGEEGTVIGYDQPNDVYFVAPDDVEQFGEGAVLAVISSMIEPTDGEDEDWDEDEGDELPALDLPGIGMSSDQLAEYVSDFIGLCTTRVVGVGQEQYSHGTHQKFEGMSLDDLLEYAEEEVEDIAVYAAMLHIRVRRMRTALKDFV